MAAANRTTNACPESFSTIPEANLLHFPLVDAIHHLDFSPLTPEENLALSFGCEECLAGLCHTLHFLGDSLVTMANEDPVPFSAESVCQLGHSLACISQLIPALALLEAKADRQVFSSGSLN
ncbi:MAG: hypothetical protein P0Y63_26075 [Klebsiella huaxiensis]|uniref:hypothetical protein n=1 Tax=Klebsiella huaxiensis TaxID=2153354 RepID=UPI0026EEE33B|nr:hypothetical protein [Klebsiella huaxiensis]WEJ88686.1 MAG: hypothetical protein P0Y63_26075 [Klebsiella huaxiensis]